MPVLYKLCDGSRYNRFYGDCLDIERGGIRGSAFVRKGFIPRDEAGYIDAVVASSNWWYEGVLRGAIHVIPKTRGTFDGGSSVTVPGYGKIDEFTSRKRYSAVINEPEHRGNWLYYAELSGRRGEYHFAFITESELRMSDTPVNIDVRDPVEEDIDSCVAWTCSVSWTQDRLTVQSFDARGVRSVFESVGEGGKSGLTVEWSDFVCKFDMMPARRSLTNAGFNLVNNGFNLTSLI